MVKGLSGRGWWESRTPNLGPGSYALCLALKSVNRQAGSKHVGVPFPFQNVRDAVLGRWWALEGPGGVNGGPALGVNCQVTLGVGSRGSGTVGTSRRKILRPFLRPLALSTFPGRGGELQAPDPSQALRVVERCCLTLWGKEGAELSWRARLNRRCPTRPRDCQSICF